MVKLCEIFRLNIWLNHVILYSQGTNKTGHRPGGKEMTNQEILDTLAENECKLFYAYCADRENLGLKAAHEAAKQALIAFANATGCHN